MTERSNPTTEFPVDAILTLERGALGAAMLDANGKQAGILVATLREDDFLSSIHRAVFVAIKRLVGSNDLPLEYLSVISELQRMGVLEGFSNGWSLVSSLGEGVVLTRDMYRRTKQLRDLSTRRKLAKSLEAACQI